jgi:hypothetical protein
VGFLSRLFGNNAKPVPSAEVEPDRYKGRPLLIVMENYVLDGIGKLTPDKQEGIRKIVARVRMFTTSHHKEAIQDSCYPRTSPLPSRTTPPQDRLRPGSALQRTAAGGGAWPNRPLQSYFGVITLASSPRNIPRDRSLSCDNRPLP